MNNDQTICPPSSSSFVHPARRFACPLRHTLHASPDFAQLSEQLATTTKKRQERR